MCGEGGEPVSQMMPREKWSFIVLFFFFVLCGKSTGVGAIGFFLHTSHGYSGDRQHIDQFKGVESVFFNCARFVRDR